MLQEKLDEVKAVMLNGEEMKSRCRDDQVLLLTNKLLQLHRQTCSTVSKSNALQVRLSWTLLLTFVFRPFYVQNLHTLTSLLHLAACKGVCP